MIPYENLYKSNEAFLDEYRTAFEEVLQSGWFILGKNVSNFESEFASWQLWILHHMVHWTLWSL